MVKEIHYLSFGASEPHELNRQIGFCNYVSTYLNTNCTFYCFVFPDEEHHKVKDVTYISLDQIDHFFETFEARMEKDTVIFNHAFFYPKIKSFLVNEYSVFIYHKLDIEYLLMKKIGLDESDYNLHKERELYLLEHCDWMYTSADSLLNYIQENHGYHQHKCSLIPSIPLNLSEEIRRVSFDGFYDDGVHFIHIGPVSNRGVRYIKKILRVPANRITIITDDVRSISKQGFYKDARLQVLPFDVDVMLQCFDKIDYVMVRPKPDVLEWIRAQSFLVDYWSHGITVLLAKEFVSDRIMQMGADVQLLESVDFELSKANEETRVRIKSRAYEIFDLSEIQNTIKFRNIKSLHLEIVNKPND